jgi:hypothetical protein
MRTNAGDPYQSIERTGNLVGARTYEVVDASTCTYWTAQSVRCERRSEGYTDRPATPGVVETGRPKQTQKAESSSPIRPSVARSGNGSGGAYPPGYASRLEPKWSSPPMSVERRVATIANLIEHPAKVFDWLTHWLLPRVGTSARPIEGLPADASRSEAGLAEARRAKAGQGATTGNQTGAPLGAPCGQTLA